MIKIKNTHDRHSKIVLQQYTFTIQITKSLLYLFLKFKNTSFKCPVRNLKSFHESNFNIYYDTYFEKF